ESAGGSTAGWHRMRPFAGLLSITVGSLLVLSLISDNAIARRPTWRLVDYAQRGCVNISSPNSERTVYFSIWLNGNWNGEIHGGVRKAPAGSTARGSSFPIPPGSSDGTYSLAYVAVRVAPGTPQGRYTFELWVCDGESRQRVPVTLVVA